MELIGLTGGMGMGKSTVTSFLAGRGELLIDTDELARRLVEPGEPALEEIRAEFGGEVVDGAGRLDRKALAAKAFESDARREALEKILHPRIRQAWVEWAGRCRVEGAKRATVVIPLLFETGAQGLFSQVICVACSVGTQQARLRARGWDGQEIARREAAQWPVSRKMDRSDGVIWNESSLAVCEMQVARLYV